MKSCKPSYILKPPPPPAPPKKGVVGIGNTNPYASGPTKEEKEKNRAGRLGLDVLDYHCHQCGKGGFHSTGYIFITRYQNKELHFCNVNCCDTWEKSIVLKTTQPVTDRRGAVAATKAKNNAEAT